MAYLLNIYLRGDLVKTEILATENEGVKSFNNFLDSQETDYLKGVTAHSLTFHETLELPTETNKTNNKKTNK